MDLSTLLFALTSILAGIISYKCSTPPNPKPDHAEKDDMLFAHNLIGIWLNSGIFIWKYLFIITGLLAAVLSLDFERAHADVVSVFGVDGGGGWDISRMICPNYGNLDESYITPSIFSWTCLTITVTFGLLRLFAFQQLGPNFTFHLATPSKLKTTGLYAYVQHPSYTAATFFMTAIFLLWVQPQGVLGCFVPERVAGEWWVRWGLRTQFGAAVGWTMWGRVRQEEQMLKREFGEEWVRWHARTKRFVPGVF